MCMIQTLDGCFPQNQLSKAPYDFLVAKSKYCRMRVPCPSASGSKVVAISALFVFARWIRQKSRPAAELHIYLQGALVTAVKRSLLNTKHHRSIARLGRESGMHHACGPHIRTINWSMLGFTPFCSQGWRDGQGGCQAQ